MVRQRVSRTLAALVCVLAGNLMTVMLPSFLWGMVLRVLEKG